MCSIFNVNFSWIDMLDKLMREYKNKYHNTIRMKPIDASFFLNVMTRKGIYTYTFMNSYEKFDVDPRSLTKNDFTNDLTDEILGYIKQTTLVIAAYSWQIRLGRFL